MNRKLVRIFVSADVTGYLNHYGIAWISRFGVDEIE